MTIILGILGLLLLALYVWYTSIVSRRNSAKEALSGIDVQLQKRGELIPNILAIAKKFMEHEKSLLEEITALRTRMNEGYDESDANAVKEHLDIAQMLQGKMGQLMVQVENYPELKSDQTMVTAMQSYNEVEAQIAASRRFYNSAVKSLNNSIEIFPGSLVAGMIGAEPMPFYEAPEESLAPVNAADHLN